jgi:hypothetical protein
MSTTQKDEKKPRSTAQLWARRQKITEQIAELTAEHTSITEQLEAELKK